MVGHLLRYHPAVTRLVEICRGGALGPLEHVEAARRSVNGDRTASALWTLGPHDLSVIHALDPSAIETLSASGPASGADARRPPRARLRPHGERGALARAPGEGASLRGDRARSTRRSSTTCARRIACSWAAPTRRRGAPAEIAITGEATVAWHEPLALEIDHFLRCVEERTPPRTGFSDGVLVVRALARAEGAIHRRDESSERSAAAGVARSANAARGLDHAIDPGLFCRADGRIARDRRRQRARPLRARDRAATPR